MSNAASMPGSDPAPSVKRTPVKAEALNVEAVTAGKEIGTAKGGDQAATVQSTEAKQVTPKAGEKRDSGQGAVVPHTNGSTGQEPHPAPGVDGRDLAALDYTIPATLPEHRKAAGAWLRINLDELVCSVQEELKALLVARRTMTWGQRELTRQQLNELTEVLVQLQDQRAAHRLIERYFDLLATNPAAAQKLPGMGALKRIAGGMANADKAAKADGRTQSEKGKRKADSFLDDLPDTTSAAQ